MAHVSQVLSHSAKAANPLDKVNLGHAEREAAKAYMERAEYYADLACNAGNGLQALAAMFGKACTAWAHRTRVALGRLAHH